MTRRVLVFPAIALSLRVVCTRSAGRAIRSVPSLSLLRVPTVLPIRDFLLDRGRSHCPRARDQASQHAIILRRESGETGRRAGLRIQWAKALGGSTPPSRTN